MIQQITFPGLGLAFSVNRVAFEVFGFPVYWYGLLIATGVILAVVYGTFAAKREGLSQDDLWNMLLWAVPVAIVCARLYYVVFRWEEYQGDVLSILDIRGGGLAIYGGIIGICLVIFLYCKKKKLSIGMVLDVLAIGLLIGQSIGRWGNFMNGEAFGSATNLPWAMTIQKNGLTLAESVHPTFFYESLWNAIGIVVLLCYRKICEFRGELFCGYLTWYGLGRVWIEGLRADSLYIGAFRVSQLLAGLTLLLGIGIILYQRMKSKKDCIE